MFSLEQYGLLRSGEVVFILIGLYMMKSGVKKKMEMQTREKKE